MAEDVSVVGGAAMVEVGSVVGAVGGAFVVVAAGVVVLVAGAFVVVEAESLQAAMNTISATLRVSRLTGVFPSPLPTEPKPYAFGLPAIRIASGRNQYGSPSWKILQVTLPHAGGAERSVTHEC